MRTLTRYFKLYVNLFDPVNWVDLVQKSLTVRNMANRSEKSRSNVLSIQNFVVWFQATPINNMKSQYKILQSKQLLFLLLNYEI